MPKIRTLLFVICGMARWRSRSAAAAEYPDRQITMVVCFPAGRAAPILRRRLVVNVPAQRSGSASRVVIEKPRRRRSATQHREY